MSDSPPQISLANELDFPRLFEVWESSVRATHSFLTETEIQTLTPLVKHGLAAFSPLHCLRDPDGKVIAFLGVAASKIEMLFVHADHRGVGAGKTLAAYAIRELGADQVEVNEQNELGVGFYQHLGFRPFGRSAFDSFGNPFPILHMRLSCDATSILEIAT